MRIRDMIFQSARPAVHPSAPNPPSVPFATFNKEPASTVVVPISTDVVTAYIPTAGADVSLPTTVYIQRPGRVWE
jgi:hypothetical protein